ncbi:HD domain-containing protein [Photorhabdus antumapuensis]|uniref:HD domain-containing protein n=1 Tax=Photorhabdus antumapuensis TaxID=2862867 RepID=UPI001CEC2B0E|nr:HD domain-containing protein [Photorhabdus antumapuensis]
MSECSQQRGNLKDNGYNDNAHDIGHLIRIANNAKRIMEKEGGEPLVIIASSYLHDIVSLPKNHPEKKQSSKLHLC